jgi:hypothetical protein
VGLAANLYRAINLSGKTGLLKVTTPQSAAVISISSSSSDAEIIGTGNGNVRLDPGTYLLAATYNGSHSSQVVSIAAKQTTHVSLTFTSSLLKSPVVYGGFDALGAHGLTDEQVQNLEQLFTAFDASAQKVSINTSNIQSYSPGSSSDSPTFTMTFTVQIDSKAYNATLNYTGLTDVSLSLTDAATNAQVYSGSSAT